MKINRLFLSLCFIFSSLFIFGQEEGSSNSLLIQYGLSSGKYQPFWLRSNQYGTVPTKGSFMQVGATYSQDYQKNQNAIKFGYGADVRFLVGTDQSGIVTPELYVKSKYGIFELWGGVRKQVWGLVDSTISSGSFVWSGNSMPIPKVEIIVPDWYYPSFLKGKIAFKGSYSHGWFENNREDVAHFYLHQKSFYGQIGRKNAMLKLFGGFTHQVQWGGTLLYPDPNNISGINGVIPSNFRTYMYVVTGLTLGNNGSNLQTNGLNDAWNRAGNHLGTVDVGAEFNVGKWKVLGYRQSYYEDGSLYYGNNITDGLHGISIQSKAKTAFRKLVLEYFNTSSQGGPLGSNAPKPWQRGQDNYFNNSVYTNGWTYRKMSIGNPFMTLDSETDINAGNKVYFDNNRVEAFYLASEWTIGKANILVKGSLANAFGNYGSIFNAAKKMYSVAAFIQKPQVLLGYNSIIKANIGYDYSEWYPSVLGIHLGVSMPLY